MNETRLKRAEQVIRQKVSEALLHDIKDPRFGFATVTKVAASKDFRYAKVFVSFMGNEQDKEKNMRVIRRSQPFLQATVAKTLNTKTAPELIFVLDESIDKGLHMAKLIKQARASDPGLVTDEEPPLPADELEDADPAGAADE